MVIQQAKLEDMQGVLHLLKANHVSNLKETEKADGFVTTNMTTEQLERLITKENGVTIAREGKEVLAFAMAASWGYWSEWPFFAYMIEKLSEFSFEGQILTTENSYQYGPVCIDRSIRGSGVFEKVFYASLSSMKGHYPIMATFINQVNHRSYAAHTKKVAMEQVGTFQFNDNDYYLMSCFTDFSNR